MNHKWNEDNICFCCGIKRIKREYKRVVGTYTALSRSGIWEERENVKYGIAWYYGIPNKELPNVIKGNGFERPDCKKL